MLDGVVPIEAHRQVTKVQVELSPSRVVGFPPPAWLTKEAYIRCPACADVCVGQELCCGDLRNGESPARALQEPGALDLLVASTADYVCLC